MSYDLESWRTELTEIAAVVTESFAGLSAEKINWKSSATSWSIGQCFDHLIVANRGMLSKIEPVIEGKHKPTFFERLPLLPKLFGRLVIKTVHPDTVKKTKNPGIFDPVQSKLDADVIEKFLEDQEKIIAAIRISGKIDLKCTNMTSPVAAFITYSVHDGFRIIIEHEKRHVGQAKRVMETEGFPN